MIKFDQSDIVFLIAGIIISIFIYLVMKKLCREYIVRTKDDGVDFLIRIMKHNSRFKNIRNCAIGFWMLVFSVIGFLNV